MILIKTLIHWKETSSGHGDFGELVNGNPLGSFSGIKMDKDGYTHMIAIEREREIRIR